jgi:hypothetical protein
LLDAAPALRILSWRGLRADVSGFAMFYIVQPYASGPHCARQATIVSTHETVEAAYDELDRIAAD